MERREAFTRSERRETSVCRQTNVSAYDAARGSARSETNGIASHDAEIWTKGTEYG